MTTKKIEWDRSSPIWKGELGERTVLIGNDPRSEGEFLLIYYSSREQLEETGVGTVYRYDSMLPAELKAIKLLTAK